MKKLLSNIIAGILGLWFAVLFVPKVSFSLLYDSSFFTFSITESWQFFLILGIILGLINFFIKPIINLITLPIRVVTLGIFGILVNMAMIFIVDAIFREINIPLWLPLLEASLVIWSINFVILKIIKSEDN